MIQPPRFHQNILTGEVRIITILILGVGYGSWIRVDSCPPQPRLGPRFSWVRCRIHYCCHSASSVSSSTTLLVGISLWLVLRQVWPCPVGSSTVSPALPWYGLITFVGLSQFLCLSSVSEMKPTPTLSLRLYETVSGITKGIGCVGHILRYTT